MTLCLLERGWLYTGHDWAPPVPTCRASVTLRGVGVALGLVVGAALGLVAGAALGLVVGAALRHAALFKRSVTAASTALISSCANLLGTKRKALVRRSRMYGTTHGRTTSMSLNFARHVPVLDVPRRVKL